MLHFCTKHHVVWCILYTVRENLQREKRPQKEHGLASSPTESSPPPPPMPAASGDLRRRATRSRAPQGPRQPTLRTDSPLPSSTARSQPHPVARVSGRLRRRVSGGPRFLPFGNNYNCILRSGSNGCTRMRLMSYYVTVVGCISVTVNSTLNKHLNSRSSLV